jgi:hypothetical protein
MFTSSSTRHPGAATTPTTVSCRTNDICMSCIKGNTLATDEIAPFSCTSHSTCSSKTIVITTMWMCLYFIPEITTKAI